MTRGCLLGWVGCGGSDDELGRVGKGGKESGFGTDDNDVGWINPTKWCRKTIVDSGSQANWMKRGALPSGVNGKVVKQRQGSTVAGSFTSSVEIDFQGIRLPEFYRNRTIDGFKAMVFNADCRYDVILGRDFLSVVGLQLDWKDHVMTWDEVTVPMKLYPAKSPNATDHDLLSRKQCCGKCWRRILRTTTVSISTTIRTVQSIMFPRRKKMRRLS